MEKFEDLEKIITESATIPPETENTLKNNQLKEVIKSNARHQSTQQQMGQLFSKTLGSQFTELIPETLKAFFPCLNRDNKHEK
ncbi:MAG: hypothetical protein ACSHX6_08625 [Akkermansiaceae bacterium]